MLVVGISGQTGAGKSTLANFLSQRGLGENVEVDAIGHELLRHQAVQHMLTKAFGAEIMVDGAVSRKHLGRVAFVDAASIERLNAIMHPAMVNEVRHKIEMARNTGARAIIINAALLFKMGLDVFCDKIIYVRAKPELRLQRLMDYRNWTRENASARLHAQDELPEHAQVTIIDNDGSEEALAEKAGNLAAVLLADVGGSKLSRQYPCSDVEIAAGEQVIFSSPDPEIPVDFLEFLTSIFSPLDEVAAVYLFDTSRSEDSESTLVIGIDPARPLAGLEVDRLSFLVLAGVEAHIHDREVLDFMVIDNDELRDIVVSLSPKVILNR